MDPGIFHVSSRLCGLPLAVWPRAVCPNSFPSELPSHRLLLENTLFLAVHAATVPSSSLCLHQGNFLRPQSHRLILLRQLGWGTGGSGYSLCCWLVGRDWGAVSNPRPLTLGHKENGLRMRGCSPDQLEWPLVITLVQMSLPFSCRNLDWSPLPQLIANSSLPTSANIRQDLGSYVLGLLVLASGFAFSLFSLKHFRSWLYNNPVDPLPCWQHHRL